MQYPPTGLNGRAPVANRGPSGAFATNGTAEATSYDPLIGKKVWTRWPEDNHFYEAVITDYNPVEVHNIFSCYLLYVLVIIQHVSDVIIFMTLQGRHALVYDMNSTNETWEWVNLKEVYILFSCRSYVIAFEE